MTNWNSLSDQLDHQLKQQAFGQAVKSIAGQAETLAQEMEAGRIADRGGAEALRLVVAIVRLLNADVSAGEHVH